MSVAFCRNIPKTLSSRFQCRTQKRLYAKKKDEKNTKKTKHHQKVNSKKNNGLLECNSARSADLLTKMCQYCYDMDKIDESNLAKRGLVLRELRNIVRQRIDREATVCAFGSSSNGFGSKDADLDISAFVAKKTQGRVWIKAMENSTKFDNLRYLRWARVPIVNFRHIETDIVGDISFSNGIAVYNTLLLRRYSQIDKRVQPLVYTVKQLVKNWKICGVKDGYISSYAYTLMVLYFLQQISPPVLPSLQMLRDDSNSPPVKRAFGYNVYFYDDIKSLEKVWEHWNTNTMTTGVLLLLFFDFYLDHFNYGRHSVCILSPKPTKKREYNCAFELRDPFERERNLAFRLSPSKASLIMRKFEDANHHLRTLPPSADQKSYLQLKEYYFKNPPHS